MSKQPMKPEKPLSYYSFMEVKKEFEKDMQQYEKDMKQYEKDFIEYEKANEIKKEDRTKNDDDDDEKGARAEKKKKEKDLNAPRRPLSEYFYFAADVREQLKFENPNAGSPEIATLIGEKWKTLNCDARSKYVVLAAEAKKQYEQDIRAYKEKNCKHKD